MEKYCDNCASGARVSNPSMNGLPPIVLGAVESVDEVFPHTRSHTAIYRFGVQVVRDLT